MNITITKVVSKNFVLDFASKLQNLVGVNLSQYEKMIDKGINQINEELEYKKIELIWFRYEITQLTNGAVAIMLYGESK